MPTVSFAAFREAIGLKTQQPLGNVSFSDEVNVAMGRRLCISGDGSRSHVWFHRLRVNTLGDTGL